MNRKNHLARCTGSAIAAVLVLGSTPLLAQQAGQGDTPVATPATSAAPAPVLQLPVDPAPLPAQTGPAQTVTAPANPAPVNTASASAGPASPAPNAQRVTVSSPVVQQVPVEAPAAAPAERAPSATTAATPSRAATPAVSAQRSAPAIAAPAAPEANPRTPEAAPDVSETATIAPGPIVPVTQPEVPVTTAEQPGQNAANIGWIAMVLSALGVIGLALLIAAAMRRRRTVKDVPVVERPRVEQPQPAAVRSSIPATPIAPVVTADRKQDAREWAPPVPQQERPVSALRPSLRDGEQGLPQAGASVALPAKIPASFAERDALLRRMVAARPDRANPFRSPKARQRRARLILQSLERTFENGKSRIDLSQYPANWPELARGGYPVAA